MRLRLRLGQGGGRSRVEGQEEGCEEEDEEFHCYRKGRMGGCGPLRLESV